MDNPDRRHTATAPATLLGACLSVGLVLAPGCSAGNNPPPKVEARPQGSSKPAAPILPPSRWFDSSGTTAIGPTLPQGKLVLLGGRRALVPGSGQAVPESAPSPESLLTVIRAPAKDGTLRLVAYSRHAVYRLDDPLGAPVVLGRTEGDAEIARVSVGPGVVAVWLDPEALPIYVDVDTGQAASWPAMQSVPVARMAFRDSKNGAGLFALVGFAETSDGGVTWHSRAPQTSDVERELDRGADAFTQAAVEDASPVVKWIQTTGMDPLVAAVRSGVRLPSGELLVPASGMFAWVDENTGIVKAMKPIRGEKGASYDESTSLVRAGDTAWFFGKLRVREDLGDSHAYFGLFSIGLGGKDQTLSRDRPASGSARRVRVSPSGGVLLEGACNAPHDDFVSSRSFCVRQPDGKWLSIHPDFDLAIHGPAPLADGRLVYLRGVDRREGPPEDQPAEAPQRSEEGDAGPPLGEADAGPPAVEFKSWLVARNSCGKEETLATLAWRSMEPMKGVAVTDPIQEGEDGRLRAVLWPVYEADEEAADVDPFVAVAERGSKARLVPAIVRETSWARLAGDVFLAQRDQGLFESRDGVEWTETNAPGAAKAWLGAHKQSLLSELRASYEWEEGSSDEERIPMTDVGIKLGPFVRVGWTAPEKPPERPALDNASPLPRHSLGASPPAAAIICKTKGAGSGAPLPGYRSGVYWAKVAPGTNRMTRSQFDWVGSVGIEPPTSGAVLGSKWALAWLDPLEIEAQPRSVEGVPRQPAVAATPLSSTTPKAGNGAPSGSSPAPKPHPVPKTSKGAPLEGFSINYDRKTVSVQRELAIFAFTSESRSMVVRTKGRGFENVDIPLDLLPVSRPALGAAEGDPVAWIARDSIVVWQLGEKPRPIVRFRGDPRLSLGRPGKDGVPVFLSLSGTTLLKAIPIPPLAPGDKNQDPAVHKPDVWLGGYQELAFDIDHPSLLPACKGQESGPRLIVQIVQPDDASIRVSVDGAQQSMSEALWDLRVDGQTVCVAAISGTPMMKRAPLDEPSFEEPRDEPPPSPPAPSKPGAAVPGPVEFLRFDLLAKKAEGGSRGLPPKPTKDRPVVPAWVRRLDCTYEVPK